ncbi:hypothetical protein Ddye_019469 [Dipteronia dyeriana]|uniref:Uncharacterized protein n=1 Tax=Dipteronia dyeriana TaxID=168575 RepID=A0AAD9TXU5_9ROSI|nr:hypothetical protein Ddye_019469 [Dipteronia dyeriana]
MNAPFTRRIREERGEALRAYVESFHKEVIQMRVFTEKETLANFRRNLWVGKVFRSFAKRPPETYQESYDRALEQIEVDEQVKVKMEYDYIRAVKIQKKEAPKPEQARKIQKKPSIGRHTASPFLNPYQKDIQKNELFCKLHLLTGQWPQ